MTEPALILLVDDEEDVLSVYKAKLDKVGFRTVTAGDGAQAIKIAAEQHPDLILMDMKMPVMDGVAAQQKLNEDPATKDIKVVFLTAFSDPSSPETDQTIAKQVGAIDFIKKGIGLDELVDKVRGYLKK
ncbi:MAG: response regulator [Candidatus Pacebacteria bacterium]|nr:response regulator [Candidatus Paceibacterota bacterium]